MQQYILHTNKNVEQGSLDILSEHGAEITIHHSSIEIKLPLGTIQNDIVQKEDSIPEAGISAKLETRYYTLKDQSLLIYTRETVMKPQSFEVNYGIYPIGISILVD